MTGCTLVSTPLPANSHFQPASPDEHAKVSSYPYLEVLGSLTYATMGMHLDISYAVRSLAPYTNNFGDVHINGLKHIMQYLSGCPKWGILYTRVEASLGTLMRIGLATKPIVGQYRGMHSSTQEELCHGC